MIITIAILNILTYCHCVHLPCIQQVLDHHISQICLMMYKFRSERN